MFVFKAAVVGAGTMGGEIAQVIAAADIPVVLKDVDQKFVDQGLEKAREVTEGQLGRLVKKEKITQEQADAEAEALLGRIHGTTEYGEHFGDVDFVIDPTLRRFDAAGLDQLDKTVRSSLGRGLITPDSVRGTSKTLRGAVTGRGWPTLAKTRGKTLVALNTGGTIRGAFLQGHPSLERRAMFVTADEQSPAAAVIKMDDPDEARIQALVKQGFIVRTRSDADLIEARNNDTSRRDIALRSGAQIVSTDFEVAVPAIGGDYVVQIPGGTPARCDPVNAPKNCRPSDVENPAQLTRRR